MSWSGPSREKVKSSVLNGLSQYLMTNTILDSIFDQPKSKPPQPSTLLTENHSLPSANTTTKPQTHSLKTTLFPIWFSFPQNPKPTLRPISQRALDDVWILVWIGVGVFPLSLSLSWSLRRRRGVGKWRGWFFCHSSWFLIACSMVWVKICCVFLLIQRKWVLIVGFIQAFFVVVCLLRNRRERERERRCS